MEEKYRETLNCKFGTIGIEATKKGICYIHLSLPKRDLKKWKGSLSSPLVKKAKKEIEAYLKGRLKKFSLPIDIREGTDFQKKVWIAISSIPYGQVMSYSDLARSSGKPKAARASGTACGKNPIPFIIPCHRVVGKSGLGGFGGGLPMKEFLLKLEQG